MVAAFQKRPHHRGNGTHARRTRHSTDATLEGRDLGLQHVDRGVATARIDVAGLGALEAVDALLNVGEAKRARLVDGRGKRPKLIAAQLACVHRARGKARVFQEIRHVHPS